MPIPKLIPLVGLAANRHLARGHILGEGPVVAYVPSRASVVAAWAVRALVSHPPAITRDGPPA